ncbi:Crp/Fnr family transcriptional regulator [Castellaniella sp.]|uniref:Crp/Fnr family transcriptional regulator n=1 Tax=Castellaniella sp. TaxID=1955812 RepID=UPI003560E8B1
MKRSAVTRDGPVLVLGHPLFQGLPAQFHTPLLLNVATLHVQDGETLFSEGDEALEYLYVLGGQVEILRHTQDGHERVFHIFRAGQLLAETAMFMSHGRYPMQARARGDSIVLCLKRQGLLAVCQAWPELALRLLARLSDQIYRRINEVEWFSDSTAAQRLAAYLLRLPEEADGRVALPLTQRQLAVHLGVRAETLSRMLAEWVAQGHLQGARRHWAIKDRPFVEKLAAAARRSF